jgi:hypothetical protein
MKKAIVLAVAGLTVLSGCGGGSSKKAFCDFQRSSGGSQAATAAAAGSSNAADLEKAASQIDKAADSVPAEIRSDMRVFVDGYLKPFYSELARVNYDFTRTNFTALAGLSRPDVQAASKRIAAYYEAHCGK